MTISVGFFSVIQYTSRTPKITEMSNPLNKPWVGGGGVDSNLRPSPYRTKNAGPKGFNRNVRRMSERIIQV